MSSSLEDRLREVLKPLAGVAEKRMFGGTCFMWNGHMLCGTFKQGYLFRVGQENDTAALARPGAKPMIHGGRRMSGFIEVAATECGGGSIKAWIDLAKNHVASLPPKSSPGKSRIKRGRK